MSKKFEGVLEQLSLTEAREPEQLDFDADGTIRKMKKAIKIHKAWIKYYGSKDGIAAYDNTSEMIKQNKKAIVALEAAIEALDDHNEALGF